MEELRREAKRIANQMAIQGLYPWMAEEVVKRESIPIYWERLIPMVKNELRQCRR